MNLQLFKDGHHPNKHATYCISKVLSFSHLSAWQSPSPTAQLPILISCLPWPLLSTCSTHPPLASVRSGRCSALILCQYPIPPFPRRSPGCQLLRCPYALPSSTMEVLLSRQWSRNHGDTGPSRHLHALCPKISIMTTAPARIAQTSGRCSDTLALFFPCARRRRTHVCRHS